MQVIAFGDLHWERVSAEAETNMNTLDRGSEVPMGSPQSGQADLTRVTGMGVVLSHLPDSQSVQLMGIGLEGSEFARNGVETCSWLHYE